MTIFFFVLKHARDLAKIYENLFLWTMPLRIFGAKTFFFIWRTPEMLRKSCKFFGQKPFLFYFLFFGDHLQNFVLGPWPWSREFLSLASASDFFFVILALASSLRPRKKWKPVGSTGRSGFRSARDSSTGQSSRLKYRSNSPFLQLKGI